MSSNPEWKWPWAKCKAKLSPVKKPRRISATKLPPSSRTQQSREIYGHVECAHEWTTTRVALSKKDKYESF